MQNGESVGVTIYQVAEQAGVSIGTVSRVLSNPSKVSETTRARVLKVIEKLNYVPSMAARGLTKGNTRVIGLLCPYTPTQLFNDPHLLGCMQGIEEALNEQNWNLLLSTATREHDPSSSYERLLRSRYIDGALVIETQESEAVSLHAQLQRQHFPWVVLGYPVGIVPCHSIHADDYQGSQALTDYLLKLGHRRIGIISAEPRPLGFEERLRGHKKILSYNGITFDENLLVYGSMTIESGYEAVSQLLKRENPPTAIFALNDRMALGAIRWVTEQGLRIPQDISIVGFDDIPAASQVVPGLTTVRQPSIKIGYEAINLLFKLIKGENPPIRMVLATELVIRNSSGPLPGS